MVVSKSGRILKDGKATECLQKHRDKKRTLNEKKTQVLTFRLHTMFYKGHLYDARITDAETIVSNSDRNAHIKLMQISIILGKKTSRAT